MSSTGVLLETFREAGVLAPLDVHVALTLERLADVHDPDVLLATAMASRAPAHGHVCVQLSRMAETVGRDGEDPAVLDELPWPAPSACREALAAAPGLVGDGTADTPLVLDGDLLYLRRYWRLQERLAQALVSRACGVYDDVDVEGLREDAAALFPDDGEEGADLQRHAAVAAVLRRLTVISGGPGTGKTYTVARILALLGESARRRGAAAPPRVALLAPTGKAAARLKESVREAAATLPTPQAEALSELAAATIHRALGIRPGLGGGPRHDASYPLPADVVIVDEASMVDLVLMARLVDAVAPEARLVLLGDQSQLASVEAGAILGDICNVGRPAVGLSPAFADRLAAAGVATSGEPGPEEPGIWDCVVRLTRSRRFPPESPIGKLARAINQGDAGATLTLVRGSAAAAEGSRALAYVGGRDPDSALVVLRDLALAAFEPVVEAAASGDAVRALDLLAAFRILCAHRRGPLGAEELNVVVRDWLASRGAIPAAGGWYAGRPVIVTRNDYQVGLFNGDVGVLVREDGGELRACFPDTGEEGVRRIHPNRLPGHETVFAMTVHKSQGSEFDRVAVVLPPSPSPVVTRELLYTGVTRARRGVTVVGPEPVLAEGVRGRVQRASGLRDLLWERGSTPG